MRQFANDDLKYVAIVSKMRITGVEISKKSKSAKQTANSKSFKTL